jgi:hypothetical protein
MNVARRLVPGCLLALLPTALPAQMDWALSFGPNDWVQVPTSASLNSVTNEITIEAWVFPRGR